MKASTATSVASGTLAEVAIDKAVQPKDLKTQPLRRVLVAARRINLSPDSGPVEEQPSRRECEHENEYLQI
jgi:hypothetical protein